MEWDRTKWGHYQANIEMLSLYVFTPLTPGVNMHDETKTHEIQMLMQPSVTAKLAKLSPEAIRDAFGLIYQLYMCRESVPHTV